MKKIKQILICTLISIIIIGVAIGLPLIPAINTYKAYNFDIPSNIPAKTENGIETTMFFASLTTVAKNLQTEDGKDALHDIVYLMGEERTEIFCKNFLYIYIPFGIILGILVVMIGIIFKYKYNKGIFFKSFIISGIMVILLYIVISYFVIKNNLSLWL